MRSQLATAYRSTNGLQTLVSLKETLGSMDM